LALGLRGKAQTATFLAGKAGQAQGTFVVQPAQSAHAQKQIVSGPSAAWFFSQFTGERGTRPNTTGCTCAGGIGTYASDLSTCPGCACGSTRPSGSSACRKTRCTTTSSRTRSTGQSAH
jgi:hypothetical protein